MARISGDLGMARRSGAIALGFDNVARALDGDPPPAVLVEAADGAADGRRKLAGTAAARGLKPALVDVLTRAELSLALGRENVIHAALKPGKLAERLVFQAGRLEGFRPAKAAPDRGRFNSCPGKRTRMSETNDSSARGAGKTLSLKKTETSTVKQSFSHGRTKAVVVEKKRARVGGAWGNARRQHREKTKPAEVRTAAPVAAPAPSPAARDRAMRARASFSGN